MAKKVRQWSAICGYYVDCGRGKGSTPSYSRKNKRREESRTVKAF